jgi:hypothetical protein
MKVNELSDVLGHFGWTIVERKRGRCQVEKRRVSVKYGWDSLPEDKRTGEAEWVIAMVVLDWMERKNMGTLSVTLSDLVSESLERI